MGTPAPGGLTSKPEHGGACPICNNGILYAIAETVDGVYLCCFNCDTRATVPSEGDWSPTIDPALQSPTGFKLTPDQLAAKQSIDAEQAAARARTAAAAPRPAEPAPLPDHAQHEVAPPGEQPAAEAPAGEQPAAGGGS